MDRRKFIKNTLYAGLALGFAAGTGFYFKNLDEKETYETFLEHYKGEYIPNLDIHLVEHCNLNCKYCCHFSNIAEPEFYSPEEYDKDLCRLKEITGGRVANLLLMGGEPLLNPKIEDFMRISRKYFPRTYIQILTNGLLLKTMPDSFWQTMSDYKILLRHSIYPAFKVEDYTFCDKKKQFDLKDFPCGPDAYSPIDTFVKYEVDVEGKYDYKKRFEACGINLHSRHKNGEKRLGHTCSQMFKGKIYHCFLSAGIRHFNKKFGKDIKVTEADYLDIYKAKNFKDVLKFMDTPTPFCKYCGPRKQEMPWESSIEHDISEWTFS